MRNETLTVEGMSCGHCVKAVETAMKEIGVEAKVDLSSKSVTVTYDEAEVTLDKIKETIEDQGYDVK